MVDHIFDSHDTCATSSEVQALLDVLRDPKVKISSVARFTTALNSHTTVKAFVEEWNLSDAQLDLLVFALRVNDKAAYADVEMKMIKANACHDLA